MFFVYLPLTHFDHKFLPYNNKFLPPPSSRFSFLFIAEMSANRLSSKAEYHPSLLGVPPEIRRRIYDFLDEKCEISIFESYYKPHFRSEFKNVVQTSHQLRRETYGLFLSKVTLRIWSARYSPGFVAAIPTHIRNEIQRAEMLEDTGADWFTHAAFPKLYHLKFWTQLGRNDEAMVDSITNMMFLQALPHCHGLISWLSFNYDLFRLHRDLVPAASGQPLLTEFQFWEPFYAVPNLKNSLVSRLLSSSFAGVYNSLQGFLVNINRQTVQWICMDTHYHNDSVCWCGEFLMCGNRLNNRLIKRMFPENISDYHGLEDPWFT